MTYFDELCIFECGDPVRQLLLLKLAKELAKQNMHQN